MTADHSQITARAIELMSAQKRQKDRIFGMRYFIAGLIIGLLIGIWLPEVHLVFG